MKHGPSNPWIALKLAARSKQSPRALTGALAALDIALWVLMAINEKVRKGAGAPGTHTERRPLTRLKINTIKATTSSRWINPPPM